MKLEALEKAVAAAREQTRILDDKARKSGQAAYASVLSQKELDIS
jgi:hypothetical protein